MATCTYGLDKKCHNKCYKILYCGKRYKWLHINMYYIIWIKEYTKSCLFYG